MHNMRAGPPSLYASVTLGSTAHVSQEAVQSEMFPQRLQDANGGHLGYAGDAKRPKRAPGAWR